MCWRQKADLADLDSMSVVAEAVRKEKAITVASCKCSLQSP